MTKVYRKLALLEQVLDQSEQRESVNGYVTNVNDKNLKNRVTALMDKVRSL